MDRSDGGTKFNTLGHALMTTPNDLPWTSSPSARTGPHAHLPVPEGAVFISAKQYCQRLGGVSYTTLQRMTDRDQDFPRPIYFGNRRYFKIADIEAYEAKAVAKAAAKAAMD
jgi:predicted DNA-binding transcriptional regulator AlpA